MRDRGRKPFPKNTLERICDKCGHRNFQYEDESWWTFPCIHLAKLVKGAYDMERFTEKDIWCISCCCYHAFDLINRKVACPKEHPDMYTGQEEKVTIR